MFWNIIFLNFARVFIPRPLANLLNNWNAAIFGVLVLRRNVHAEIKLLPLN